MGMFLELPRRERERREMQRVRDRELGEKAASKRKEGSVGERRREEKRQKRGKVGRKDKDGEKRGEGRGGQGGWEGRGEGGRPRAGRKAGRKRAEREGSQDAQVHCWGLCGWQVAEPDIWGSQGSWELWGGKGNKRMNKPVGKPGQGQWSPSSRPREEIPCFWTRWSGPKC